MRWSEAPVPVSPTDLRSLALIYAANWLEQFDRMRPKARVGRMEEMRRLADWLGGTPKADVYAAYGFNVAHTMGLEEINEAFELMHEGKSIRTVIHY